MRQLDNVLLLLGIVIAALVAIITIALLQYFKTTKLKVFFAQETKDILTQIEKNQENMTSLLERKELRWLAELNFLKENLTSLLDSKESKSIAELNSLKESMSSNFNALAKNIKNYQNDINEIVKSEREQIVKERNEMTNEFQKSNKDMLKLIEETRKKAVYELNDLKKREEIMREYIKTSLAAISKEIKDPLNID